MKKFFSMLSALFMIVMFSNTQAFADAVDYVPHKMTVQFEQDFSTDNPPREFSVVINDNYEFPNVRPIEKGTQIFLEVTKVSQAKRAKMDASVQARIVRVYIPSTDETINVNNPKAVVRFSKYEKLDVADKALNTGISVANHFVKNITYPAQFVKGAVQNKEGNMLKSGFNAAYEASPLSYIEKGESLDLQSGDLATLTFFSKIKKSDSTQVSN